MRCRMFNSTPGFYPLDAIAPLPLAVTTKNVSEYCQMSPGGQIAPVESHWARETEDHSRDSHWSPGWKVLCSVLGSLEQGGV